MKKKYTEIFKEATDLLNPINEILKKHDFIESCVDKLCEDGVKFQIGNSEEITIQHNNSAR